MPPVTLLISSFENPSASTLALLYASLIFFLSNEESPKHSGEILRSSNIPFPETITSTCPSSSFPTKLVFSSLYFNSETFPYKSCACFNTLKKLLIINNSLKSIVFYFTQFRLRKFFH